MSRDSAAVLITRGSTTNKNSLKDSLSFPLNLNVYFLYVLPVPLSSSSAYCLFFITKDFHEFCSQSVMNYECQSFVLCLFHLIFVLFVLEDSGGVASYSYFIYLAVLSCLRTHVDCLYLSCMSSKSNSGTFFLSFHHRRCYSCICKMKGSCRERERERALINGGVDILLGVMDPGSHNTRFLQDISSC